jgi:hypothetical protein
MYNSCMLMKLVSAIILANLSGCALTGASLATTAATGKGIADHALSTASGADCNVLNYLKGMDYWCERRDIAETYNRNPF